MPTHESPEWLREFAEAHAHLFIMRERPWEPEPEFMFPSVRFEEFDEIVKSEDEQ